MKKRLLAALAAVMVISTFTGTTVFAADLTDENNYETTQAENVDSSATTFDLNQLVMYRRLPDGTRIRVIAPRYSLSDHTIEAGETMEYHNFYLGEGQKVTFRATFNRRITYECGFSGADYTERMKNGTGSSFSVSKSMPASGDYYFYITNDSDEPVTVKSGSIQIG